jgi:pimeloyl-ACP methyl ester carboxylesterase
MATVSIEPARTQVKHQTTHNPRAVEFIRRVFAVLGKTTPAFGAWLAEQIFVTPRRYQPPAHEQAVRSQASHAFQIPHEGLELEALSWGEGPRIVLLAHGWEGRGTQLGQFVAPLVAQGFRVIAFDGPAHGRSPGRQTDLAHFSRVFKSIEAVTGPIYGVVAHSFGGAACMAATGAGYLHPERMVLVGVPFGLMYPLGQFREVAALPDSIWTRLLRRMERRLGIAPEKADMCAMFNDLHLPGVLIHCEDDTEVLFENAERIHAAWPQARLMTTQGLGHRRILKDPEVIREAVTFLSA